MATPSPLAPGQAGSAPTWAAPGGDDGSRRTALSNGLIAVVMLLVSETMFFTGLIGAYIFLRGGTPGWHPDDAARRLPLGVTTANTAVLLASAVTMYLAVRADRARTPERSRYALHVTAFLGTLFLVIQGSEWLHLLGNGLTLSSSLYGATFYVLIGTHGLHVVAAVAWLLVVTWKSRRGSPASGEAVRLCGLYWYFVSGLWLALFGLVYL